MTDRVTIYVLITLALTIAIVGLVLGSIAFSRDVEDSDADVVLEPRVLQAPDFGPSKMPTSKGGAGQVLVAGVDGQLEFQTFLPGNISGPFMSRDRSLARFDGAAGHILQDSGIKVDDANNIDGIVDLTAGGVITLGSASLIFPNTDGNAGEVIKTNGQGNLCFGAPNNIAKSALYLSPATDQTIILAGDLVFETVITNIGSDITFTTNSMILVPGTYVISYGVLVQSTTIATVTPVNSDNESLEPIGLKTLKTQGNTNPTTSSAIITFSNTQVIKLHFSVDSGSGTIVKVGTYWQAHTL